MLLVVAGFVANDCRLVTCKEGGEEAKAGRLCVSYKVSGFLRSIIYMERYGKTGLFKFHSRITHGSKFVKIRHFRLKMPVL